MNDPTYELRLRRTALRICLDWLNSPDFRNRLSLKRVQETSSLWQEILYQRETSGTYLYEQTMKHWWDAIKYAEKCGWIEVVIRKVGRPRTKEYGIAEISKAEGMLNQMGTASSTAKRLRSVAGDWQPESVRVMAVTDQIWAAFMVNGPLEHCDEISREQLQAITGFTPSATNGFYRWLKDSDWKERRVNQTSANGEIARARVLYRASLNQ